MKLFTVLLLLGCLFISAVNCRGHVAEIFEMGGNINGIQKWLNPYQFNNFKDCFYRNRRAHQWGDSFPRRVRSIASTIACPPEAKANQGYDVRVCQLKNIKLYHQIFLSGPVTWNKPIKIADMLQDRMGHQNLDLQINAETPESIM